MEGIDPSFSIVKVCCVDAECRSIMFVSTLENPIECLSCGQVHDKSKFYPIERVSSHETNLAMEFFVSKMKRVASPIRRGPEMLRVLGMSNFYCKLLSPFLTEYGMDNRTSEPKLLREMNMGSYLDCKIFCDRAFLINPDHIDIPGFGRDITGSMIYLEEILQLIRCLNHGEERLIPIHTDGDGHCLVHAISRALVGRQLFWHPLRCNLKMLFENNLDKFKGLFQDYFDDDEWPTIIEECDPDFVPPENELHGLRNIHIFGLANVIRRPIILLDSLENMQKSADYSAVFLPGFMKPEDCRGKDGSLNKPICIAWSSNSHNHYIPLVGIQGKPLPVLPQSLFPKVWGMSQGDIMSYVEFDEDEKCIISGDRVLNDSYIKRLAGAMEDLFIKHYKVHPLLIEDAKLYLTQTNVHLNKIDTILDAVRTLLSEGRLIRCLACNGLCEVKFKQISFSRGHPVFNAVLKKQRRLVHGSLYTVESAEFNSNVTCKYDSRSDVLIPDLTQCKLGKCVYCTSSRLEIIKGDGSPRGKLETVLNIKNSSQSDIPQKSARDDDTPSMLTLTVVCNNVRAVDVIPDFQLVSKEGLGEAIAYMSAQFISKHFPSEVDNVELQTHVAEEILNKIGGFTIPPSQMENLTALIEEVETCIATEASMDPVVSEDTQVSMKSDDSATATSSGEAPHVGTSEVKEREETVPETKMETEHAAEDKDLSIPIISPESPCVKVVYSNTQQANLALSEEGIVYSKLQEWIYNTFSIPIQNQCIKIDFPPKILNPPNDISQPLPLKHGDRLMVENCPVNPSNRPAAPVRTPARDLVSPLTNAELDAIWYNARKKPKEFHEGGKYYLEAVKNRVMTDLCHFPLESIPHKKFSYNRKGRCLELCLKPWGHFEICPDLDSSIAQVQQGIEVNGFRSCPVMVLKPGYRDPILHKTPKRPLAALSSPTETNTLVRKGPGFSIISNINPNSMDTS